MKLKQSILIILSFFCCGIYAVTVQNDFYILSESSGLKDLLVNEIYKDSKGYVWIGTAKTLERYDGLHLRHYAVEGKNAKTRIVNSIIEAPDGEIWMGNGDGLWMLEHKNNKLERIFADNIKCRVSDMKKKDGIMFIATDAGLFIYDTKKGGRELTQLKVDDNLFSAANHITSLHFDFHGNLWLGTEAGLCRLSINGKILQCKVTAQISIKDIECLDNHVFIAKSGNGLCTYNIAEGTFEDNGLAGCEELTTAIVSSLTCDNNQHLFIGVDGEGVLVYDVKQQKITKKIQHTRNGEGSLLPSNSVYKVYIDREGQLWVGLYQLGLAYSLYRSEVFSIYAYQPHFSSQSIAVRAIAFDGKERVIGTREGLYYINEQDGRFRFFDSRDLNAQMVFAIKRFNGNYLIGTYGGGIKVLNPNTLTISNFDKQNGGTVFCIKEDKQRSLWIGTSSGLLHYDKTGELLNSYTSKNSKLPQGNVYEVFFDTTGTGWICTENGMCLWDPAGQTLRDDLFPEGFINKEKIRVVYEDSKNLLYFLPDKGRVFTSNLSMTKFCELNAAALSDRDVYSIIEDKFHNFWFTTSDGLFCRDKKGHFERYNFKDGVTSSVFTLCQPIIDDSDNLWFGNSMGLLYTSYNALAKHVRIPYGMRFTQIEVDGMPYNTSLEKDNKGVTTVRLNGSGRNVKVYFSDFSYTSPKYARFEYRREGKDSVWTSVSEEANFSDFKLPIGSNEYAVRPIGDESAVIRLRIVVFPSTATIMECILVLLLLIGIGFVVRHIWKHRKMVRKIVVKTVNPEQDKYAAVNISKESCENIAKKLRKSMEKDLLWKNPDLKIADLAQAIGESSSTISYVFGQHMNTNYYDFVNNYRIEEFKRIVATDNSISKYTLAALATMCGFSSRASFFRYFKKAFDITPNEYIKQFGKQ